MHNLSGGWLYGVVLVDGRSPYNTTRISFKFKHPYFFNNADDYKCLLNKLQKAYNPNNVEANTKRKLSISVDRVYDLL